MNTNTTNVELNEKSLKHKHTLKYLNIKLKTTDKFIQHDEFIAGHIYINFLNKLINSQYYKNKNLYIKLGQCFNFYLKNDNVKIEDENFNDVNCYNLNCIINPNQTYSIIQYFPTFIYLMKH